MRPGRFKDQLVNPVKLSDALEALWASFLELSFSGRSYIEGGPLPLSSTEILSWCQLNQLTLQPWELRAIRLLDTAWLSAQRKEAA